MFGILITYNHAKWLTYLNQSVYVYQILNHFNMKDTTSILTLLVVKHNLFASQSLNSKAKKWAYKDYAKGIYYLLLMGSLLFATQIWPNIQFAVSLITQFGTNPGIAHLEVAKCILHYLKSTIEFSLVLGKKTKDSFDLVK